MPCLGAVSPAPSLPQRAAEIASLPALHEWIYSAHGAYASAAAIVRLQARPPPPLPKLANLPKKGLALRDCKLNSICDSVTL